MPRGKRSKGLFTPESFLPKDGILFLLVGIHPRSLTRCLLLESERF